MVAIILSSLRMVTHRRQNFVAAVSTICVMYVVLLHSSTTTDEILIQISEYYSDFSCELGVPCEYADIVDLRVIVMTYKSGTSLMKLLKSLDELELDGDKASLEIWIDRDQKTQLVDADTLTAARSFEWKRGQTRVHIHKKHVGISGQWVDTWRPREAKNGHGKEELALILEDDLSVSKYAYRWLRAVHRACGNRTDYSGITLNSHDSTLEITGEKSSAHVSHRDTLFMSKIVGSWGFAPQSYNWRNFQDWFHEHQKYDAALFSPKVPDENLTELYQSFEKRTIENSMWKMWFMYYTHMEQIYCIHSNLEDYTQKKDSCVGVKRREVGLYYPGKGNEHFCELLTTWEEDFVKFPEEITKVGYDGQPVVGYF